MKNAKEFAVPTITLFAICLVAALLLAVTNSVTAPKIAENDAAAQKEAMLVVMPDAADFGETKADETSGCSYSEANAADGSVIGYAVTATGKGGYGGDITIMVGVDPEGKVTGLSFLSIDETPSIGGKLVKNESFLAQFLGLSGSAKLKANGGTVDAVSGATKTSTGITDAVNNALICYENIKGEVSGNG